MARFLVDGTNLLHRAFFVASLRSGAQVADVTNLLSDMIGWWCGHLKIAPADTRVAFDGAAGALWRRAIYPAYKQGRKEKPPLLLDALEEAPHAIERLGAMPVMAHDWEADDVLATLAELGPRAGHRISILTSDKDLLQTFDLGWVAIYLPANKIREARIYGGENWIRDYGFPPPRFADYKALTGDKSDNIDGLRGFGPVGARRFLQDCPDGIEHTLALVEGLGWTARTQIQKLWEARDLLRRNLQLVTLRRDVPGLEWAI